MSEAFAIRIYVPDGDPEGVRIIDRPNWRDIGLAFPRNKWKDVCKRNEFKSPGVYILVGYKEEDDDLGDTPPGTMQGPRCTSLEKKKNAKKVADLAG